MTKIRVTKFHILQNGNLTFVPLHPGSPRSPRGPSLPGIP